MYDIGEDIRDSAESVSAPGARRFYPGLTINDKILPLLAGAKVGDEMRIEAVIKITGTRAPEDWDTTQKGTYVSFDILQVGEPLEQAS